jgi:hypothetical protein
VSEPHFTDHELLAYLDEMLPVERMTLLEQKLRQSDSLRRKLAAVSRHREHGAHTVGEVWRQARLSCPSRARLGSYLLGTLQRQLTEYVEFHIRTIGCRYCAANLQDLESQMEATPETQRRRRRFFQSSAGYLRRSDEG